MLDRTFLTAAAAMVISLPAVAQDRGIEALEAAASSFKDMRTLSFQSSLSNSEGSMTADIKSDLNVRIIRPEDKPNAWNIRYTGIVSGLGTAGDTDGNLQIEVHDDGTATTHIDFKEETVHIHRSRLAKGAPVQMATYSTQFLEEYRSEAPFASSIADAEVTFLREEQIGGVSCEVVKVVKSGTNITETWWFAKTDHFPRKYLSSIPQMGDTTIAISDVKVNEKIDPDDLTVVFPPNFEIQDRGPNRAANAANTGPAPRRRGAEVGNEAPDFELTNASGETVRLTALRPNVVVLNFWGSWCLPCMDANDELQQMADHFADKEVTVLSLACKEANAEAAPAKMQEEGWSFELLTDASKTARIYTVRKYPTIIVIGREGEVLYTAKGYDKDESPFAEITSTIEEYLAAPVAKPTVGTGGTGASGGG